MIKNCLAIPLGSFLLVVLLFPASALCDTDNPQQQASPPQQTTANAPAAVSQKEQLSDEDMARLYLIRKQYREAQDLFHKLTVEQPKNAVYWNELGISFHNEMDLNSALKCYRKSEKLDPHYADAHNNEGTIYYERLKYPKAIRAYKKAITIRADYAGFYLNLGYAYFGHKEYEDSITAFRKALQLDPDIFDAARSRSGTIVQDRTVSTDRARFYFMLAKSFAESGNAERCVIYLKKARDEGYKDLNLVKSDPSFVKVIKDPAVQDVLASDKTADAVQQ
jgi:tetratricopeptide (TPR) repeat protein